MFYRTIQESAVPGYKTEDFDTFVIDSMVESYEDLANFNEALHHLDIKEAELIYSESTELASFQEGALDKAKAFLVNLIKKIKAKFFQFVTFVNKKLMKYMMKKMKKSTDEFKNSEKIDKSRYAEIFMTNKHLAVELGILSQAPLKPGAKQAVPFADYVVESKEFIEKAIKELPGIYDSEKDDFNTDSYINKHIGLVQPVSANGGKSLCVPLTIIKDPESGVEKCAKALAFFLKNNPTGSLTAALKPLEKAAGEEIKEAAKKANWVHMKARKIVMTVTSGLVMYMNATFTVLTRVHRYLIGKSKEF